MKQLGPIASLVLTWEDPKNEDMYFIALDFEILLTGFICARVAFRLSIFCDMNWL